ncbi:MAG TPA: hypothetical protein VLZ75_11420 [Chitinophagales bacterium]|nr:hypothetical protein [Chitinophagales bacterium]
MKKILKAIFFLSIILLTTPSVFACKIKSWKSQRSHQSLPLRQLSIIGFNYTEIQDSIIEKWFDAEIKEKFNSVKNIITVLPDTTIKQEYEQWMTPYRNLKIDAIITYAILPYKRNYSIKNPKEYSPIINEPSKNSLWSYYASLSTKVEIPEDEDAPYYVEINIYEQSTLQLIWSGISQTFDDRNDLKTIQKWMEKLITTAAKQGVINSEKD